MPNINLWNGNARFKVPRLKLPNDSQDSQYVFITFGKQLLQNGEVFHGNT